MDINNQLLHFSDPDCTEFEAVIHEQFDLPGGQTGVVLDRTYFYPTGGGQEHDTGSLGDRKVLDVYRDQARGFTVHVLDGRLHGERVAGRIDADRRRRHRQHHTAQHLLSGCFLEVSHLETVSANINGDAPSTLDLDGPEPDQEALRKVETFANSIIWENRLVSSYFVAPENLNAIPLRKAPKVTREIRIVEIAGLDWSACGGAHVNHTGAIGVVKIVRTEKVKEKTRIHFVAGERALEYFQWLSEVAGQMTADLKVGIADLAPTVARLGEQLRTAQRELTRMQVEALVVEAHRRYEMGEIIAGRRLVFNQEIERPIYDLRMLASEIRSMPGAVAVLVSETGSRVTVVVACADGCGIQANDLLQRLLAPISGRGGGDASLAQGGGVTAQRLDLGLLQDQVRQWIETATHSGNGA